MCVCVYVCVCPTPWWPLSWTRTLPACREMVDCGNDRAVLQCTGLNVKLIFNVWHFTQIIPPQTWPWGIPQIAFSVPQQLWNYSSQWEREKEARREAGRGGAAFEFGEMIALLLLWPSQTGSSPLVFLCDIMIAGPCQIENILAVWRLYEITIYYV